MVANSVGEQMVRSGALSNDQAATIERNIKSVNTEFLKALVAAQKEMRNASKSGFNTYDEYKYATLEDFIEAAKEPLNNHDLVLLYDMVGEPAYTSRKTSKGEQVVARIHVLATIVHVEGGYMSVMAIGEGQDRGDKALYKAFTGARKYALSMLLGIHTTDDPEEDSPDNGGQPAAPKEPIQGRKQPPTTVVGPWTQDEQEALLKWLGNLKHAEEYTALQGMEYVIHRMENNDRLLSSKEHLSGAIAALNSKLDQFSQQGHITDEAALDFHTRVTKLLGLKTANEIASPSPPAPAKDAIPNAGNQPTTTQAK